MEGALASKWRHTRNKPITHADAVLVFSFGLASSYQLTGSVCS